MKAQIALILGLLTVLTVTVNEARAVPYDPYGVRAAVIEFTSTGIQIGFPDDPVDEVMVNAGELKIGKLTGSGTMKITGQDLDNRVNFEIRNGTAAGTGATAVLRLISTDEIELQAVTHTQITTGEFLPPFGTTAAEPATCTTGAIYVDTTIPVMKVCSPDDTWTP